MTHRPLRRGMCVWNCPNCIERGIWRPDFAGHVQAADAVSVHPTEHLPRAGAHLQQHSSWGRRHVRGDKCPALWSTVSVIPVTGPCQPDLRHVARILFQSRQGWKGQSSARRMSGTRKGNERSERLYERGRNDCAFGSQERVPSTWAKATKAVRWKR